MQADLNKRLRGGKSVPAAGALYGGKTRQDSGGGPAFKILKRPQAMEDTRERKNNSQAKPAMSYNKR